MKRGSVRHVGSSEAFERQAGRPQAVEPFEGHAPLAMGGGDIAAVRQARDLGEDADIRPAPADQKQTDKPIGGFDGGRREGGADPRRPKVGGAGIGKAIHGDGPLVQEAALRRPGWSDQLQPEEEHLY